MVSKKEKVRPQDIISFKRKKQKISALSTYDYPFAKIADEAGIDIILVGDSLANVILGHENTLGVTMEEMLHHVRAVKRAVKHALVIGDMPACAFAGSKNHAIDCAFRFLEAGADGVKIESDHYLDVISELTRKKVLVMGHLGFTPQFVKELGGYKIQGKTKEAADIILESAKKLSRAGVFSVVLEMMTPESAKTVTASLNIPTIGCGSGKDCDGQILVLHDILGLTAGKVPGFVKKYADLGKQASGAIKKYISEVKKNKVGS